MGEWKYYDKKGKLITKGEYNKMSKTFETVFGENLKKTLNGRNKNEKISIRSFSSHCYEFIWS